MKARRFAVPMGVIAAVILSAPLFVLVLLDWIGQPNGERVFTDRGLGEHSSSRVDESTSVVPEETSSAGVDGLVDCHAVLGTIGATPS